MSADILRWGLEEPTVWSTESNHPEWYYIRLVGGEYHATYYNADYDADYEVVGGDDQDEYKPLGKAATLDGAKALCEADAKTKESSE